MNLLLVVLLMNHSMANVANYVMYYMDLSHCVVCWNDEEKN